MLEGVGIVVLEASQGEQGILIAKDGVHHALDHGFQAIHLDLLPQAHVLHEIAHDLVGLVVHPAGPGSLVGQGRRTRHLDLLGRDGQHLAIQIGADFLLGPGMPDVGPLHSVDIDLAYPHGADARHRFLVEHGKAIDEEGVVQPTAVQVMDEHAGLQLVDTDLFDHKTRAGRNTGRKMNRFYPINPGLLPGGPGSQDL